MSKMQSQSRFFLSLYRTFSFPSIVLRVWQPQSLVLPSPGRLRCASAATLSRVEAR